MGKSQYDCGVYSITAPSGNQYIGSSIDIPRRFREHRAELSRDLHCNAALQNSWNKYQGQLEFKQLLVCEPKDVLLYEQQYLDFYKPEYNICKVAGNTLGVKPSEETKAKIAKVWLGRKHTTETRLKMSLSSKGKPKTPEHIINMAAAKKGVKTKPASEERKRKISLANKGKKRTGAALERIILANKKRFGKL